jgi:putative ABC transport system substrate-binding protein
MASSAVFVPKGLEWLLTIAPGTKRVFVPHNPDDKSSVIGLNALQKATAAYRVELIVSEIYTLEEVAAIGEYIPKGVDAVFLLPDNLVIARITDFVRIAEERTLPLASVIYPHAKAGALMGYGFDSASIGQQAARIANQVLNGVRPADLPVETPEFYLSINLKTAQAIGLDIPDDVLRQADQIIR